MRGVLLLLAILVGWTESPQAQDGREIAKLVAPDGGPDDSFGYAVDIDGDIAVVGAPGDRDIGTPSGAVYVFAWRDPAWEFRKKIVSKGGIRFGAALELRDDLLLVGAPWSVDVGHDRAGLVYGFRRDHGGPENWGQAFEIHSPAPKRIGYFGESLQRDGDRLVIGSGLPFQAPCRGEAFVYLLDGEDPSTWKLEASLAATGSYGTYDPWGFGLHVSIDGDTILVASANSCCSGVWGGGLHVFERSRSGPNRWAEVAFLESPTGDWQDQFGLGGSEIRGNTIFATAASWDSVYLFERDLGGPNAWGLAKTMTLENHMPDAVATDGELLFVGAPWGSPPPPIVRVYARDLDGPNSWPPVADLRPSDPSGDVIGFGTAVAMDGDVILVGHWPEECAYLFDLTPSGSAMVSFRTDSGGANPPSYTGDLPAIGGSYDAVVDLTTTGHSLAMLFAYDAPAEIPLATGYVLLCTDLGSGPLFPFLVAAGPLASFSLPIPDDPRLFGLPLFTQAAHFGGTTPFALSNAQDLVLGYE